MIIDFHTHTFPDRIAEKAIAGIQQKCRSAAFTDGTANGLTRSMEEAGIDRCVVLPVATNPEKLESMNRAAIEQNGKNGRICFGAMHPLAENWKAQLDGLKAAGIQGIKLHPVYQGVDITDGRYLRILERCGELELIVVTHAGDEIAYPGIVRCSPEMIAAVLRQVGPVKLVLAHMGGWRNWDRVVDCLGPTGVFVDTALSLGRIEPVGYEHREEAELLLLEQENFCRMVEQLGSERVLFGTDSPWGQQKRDLDAIRALRLSAGQKGQILGANARALLKI